MHLFPLGGALSPEDDSDTLRCTTVCTAMHQLHPETGSFTGCPVFSGEIYLPSVAVYLHPQSDVRLLLGQLETGELHQMFPLTKSFGVNAVTDIMDPPPPPPCQVSVWDKWSEPVSSRINEPNQFPPNENEFARVLSAGGGYTPTNQTGSGAQGQHSRRHCACNNWINILLEAANFQWRKLLWQVKMVFGTLNGGKGGVLERLLTPYSLLLTPYSSLLTPHVTERCCCTRRCFLKVTHSLPRSLCVCVCACVCVCVCVCARFFTVRFNVCYEIPPWRINEFYGPDEAELSRSCLQYKV